MEVYYLDEWFIITPDVAGLLHQATFKQLILFLFLLILLFTEVWKLLILEWNWFCIVMCHCDCAKYGRRNGYFTGHCKLVKSLFLAKIHIAKTETCCEKVLKIKLIYPSLQARVFNHVIVNNILN